MEAIVELQRPFASGGDEAALRPMALKDVAARTGLDVSTVSRAVGEVRGDGLRHVSLKWFFGDGLMTAGGEAVSVRRIQAALRELVETEDKRRPLSDEELAGMLN